MITLYNSDLLKSFTIHKTRIMANTQSIICQILERIVDV
ncbi:hypothetical protein CIN_17210 [Commensalibacter intestini A911]|uniref:Uncharacterized protein n=1 Tax=Commensalibacter intestini A911 TaxID=1088868 RepID=G6F275_9PROT|nr:hypothetical protein CIN_17210 [Commensalibacter intestini A911]